MRGEITENWDYDVMFSHGESRQSQISAGYTNLANIENALNAVTMDTCRTGAGCVPLNLFGHPAGITPAQVQYSSATALEQREYSQDILLGTVSGSFDEMRTPWADRGVAVSFGAEYREESGGTTPDECLKFPPVSCLGGAGGNILPVQGGFSAYEYFGETIIPIASGQPFAESLDLELGYRYGDYDPTDATETWKVGLSWSPIPSLRFRAMQQQAVRSPNVEEIASPRTTGLDNADFDPCSVGNPNPIDATLTALCISTGMTLAQVGTVEDIVSGQVNTFIGTNFAALPEPETADTTTFGVVWTPDIGSDLFTNPVLTLDYYNIKIEDYIDAAPAQGVLDGCYVNGLADQCDRIVRIGGTLTVDGSGVETLFENLEYLQAEGIELGANFGVDLQTLGSLDVSFNANYYLTQEFHSYSNLAVIECVGFYSSACGGNFGTPLSEYRWIQRTTWNLPYMDDAFQISYLWRHYSEVEADKPVFAYFQDIPAYGYLDLVGWWQVTDAARLTAGVTNVLNETPPIVGNEAADTSSNSLNTFPSTYDPLGRVFSIGFNLRF
jgi:outer membrane receptor protein involved in Fe transport